MNHINSPQMPLDNNLDLKHTSDYLNQTDTINSPIYPTTTPIEISEPPSSTSIEISLTPENDQVTSRDWFNLARKLRKQNGELLESIVKLEQSLAESQKQLQEQVQQAHQNDFLIAEKTAQVNAIKNNFKLLKSSFRNNNRS